MQLQYDLNIIIIIIKRATVLFSFSLSRDIDNILVSVYPPLFCSKNLIDRLYRLYNGKNLCFKILQMNS